MANHSSRRKYNPKSAQIIDTLSEKYKLHRQVIKTIVESPFRYFKHVAADIGDMKPVRFRYFGAFVQRPVKNKYFVMQRQYDKLVRNIGEVYAVMGSVLKFPVKDEESAKGILDAALATKDIWKINDIYKAWREYHDAQLRGKKQQKNENI